MVPAPPPNPLPPGYPVEWETDALLKDGATVRVRPIRPDDSERMERFHSRQSPESIYFRYFRHRPKLSSTELEYFTTIDYRRRMAFIALIGEEMVAVSRYEGESAPEGQAEVAFFVDDAHHGRGLATLMLEYLAQRARSQGITTFTASVLSENYRMLGVFKGAGFDVSTRFADGAIDVTLGISDTDASRDAIDARDQQARSQAVARFMAPASIVVVGAGRSGGSVGHELLRSILDGGFVGTVAAVNPNASEPILGVPTFATVGEAVHEGAGEPIDLAVISLPAESVFTAIQQCIDAGVRAALVVSAGFDDTGSEGLQRRNRLVRMVRDGGIRLVGPLSYGIVNTDPNVRLSAHFLDVDVPAGDVGLLSQSGPLGAAILNQFADYGLGVSTFLSAGIRADVSVYDVLQYWIGDPATRTVALYLENFGNPRNIVKLARRISAVKPVVAVRPGDDDLAAVAEAGGFVLVDQVSELVDQVRLIGAQPLPRGDSVVIVSNAGSVAQLTRSACERAGLTVVAPGEIGLENHSSASGSVLVDDADTLTFTRSVDADGFERAVVAAAVSESVDSVLLALVPTPLLPEDHLARIVADVDRAVDKPVVAVNLVGRGAQSQSPPTFAYPEQAANALGRMARYSRWRRDHEEPAQEPEPVPAAVAAVAAVLGDNDDRLLQSYDADAADLFTALQLPLSQARLATTEREAASIAEELGYPVALKASWRTDRQAGEAGGTILDIRHKQHLRRAFKRMEGSPEQPVIVQAMVGTGAHLRILMRQSPRSGSHLCIGIGGMTRRDLPPVARLVLPTTDADIERLLADRDLTALTAPYGAETVSPVIERLSDLASGVPDIAEIDLNPVIVSDGGVVAVDATVRLRRWPVNPLASVRTV